MKIALVSDSHNNARALDEAIREANGSGARALIHAGDLSDAVYIENLKRFNGRVIFVFGNNDLDRDEMVARADGSNIEIAGDVFDGHVGDCAVFAAHYPHLAEKAIASGSYDLIVHGHTHAKRMKNIRGCVVINPGEIEGARSGESTFALFDTRTMGAEFRTLPHRQI
jgi:putative phosphoesterase